MYKSFVVLVVLCSTLFAQAQEWKQDSAHTKVTFKIKNMGIVVDGHFNTISINTNFNINALEHSYLNATLQVASLETGMESRDRHLFKADFFNVDTFKTIQLVGTKITKTKSGTYELEGMLTMKNTTKKVYLPLVISQTETTLDIRSSFELNRRDYAIGGGAFILSKKVKVEVLFKATKN